MTMTTALRKLMLTTHVITSVGWLGALAVFLAHALVGLISRDEQMIRATSIAMGLTAWLVILPLSITSLVTGLVQALGTVWGLFRHYWIIFKLTITAVATTVLLLKLGPITHLANEAAVATFSSADLIGLRMSLLLHAIGGLLLLLVAASLAIYKPPGLTPFGMRKQSEPSVGGAVSGIESDSNTPRWVKLFGLIAVVMILLVGIMVLGGGHGAGAHISPNR